jgi:DNA-binding MarR family transcriptional regulator
MREDLLDRAMAGFWPALGVVDPVRIQAWDSLGLTIGQLRLLSALLINETMTVGELAEDLGVRPPTATGVTDRLVRQGLIERTGDPADRRIVRIGLTEEGRRAMREIEDVGRAFLAPIFERLGSQKVLELIRVFDEFVEAARTVREEARSTVAVGLPGLP